MNWIFKQLARDGRSWQKYLCSTFVVIPTLFLFTSLGYGIHFTENWLDASPCDRIGMVEPDSSTYQRPGALSDDELAVYSDPVVRQAAREIVELRAPTE